MTSTIIITVCVLLLLAYIFDLTTSRTRIPTVILLLGLGWAIRQIVDIVHIKIPGLEVILPVFGTIGLILIVLEGALELEVNKTKIRLARTSSLISIFSIIAVGFTVAIAFNLQTGVGFRTCLINAVPLAIISSAIAIPSSRTLSSSQREFVTYESSISDIFGVILFNFIVYNESFGILSLGTFFFQVILIIGISLITTFGLLLLLKNLKHHVKYTPIILLIILVYTISKDIHLPSLVFILFIGMMFANLQKFAHIPIVKKLHPEILSQEVVKFKEILTEMTFLIRSVFFLTFGFMIESAQLVDVKTILWAVTIVMIIFLFRWLFLKSFGIPSQPLIYIAPRGLITILLFLSIPAEHLLAEVNNSLIIQVVVLSALVMMYGLVKVKAS